MSGSTEYIMFQLSLALVAITELASIDEEQRSFSCLELASIFERTLLGVDFLCGDHRRPPVVSITSSSSCHSAMQAFYLESSSKAQDGTFALSQTPKVSRLGLTLAMSPERSYLLSAL